jgi:amino acid transporter
MLRSAGTLTFFAGARLPEKKETLSEESGSGGESTSVPSRLPRAMGLLDTTLFLVTAGCTLQWTATAAATGPSSLMVWLIGGLTMFVPLSVCIVYLCSRFPDECGMYGWSARAFGPFAGFITGWTYWTGTLAFLPTVLYFIAGSSLLWSPTSTTAAGTPTYFVCSSFIVLAICAILNVRGLSVAKWLNGAGAIARWVGIVLLVVFALASWWRFGPATDINRHTLAPAFRLSDVIFWTTLAFAWTGPEAVSFMSGEIRDPRRTAPKALTLAAPMIAAVYIIGTASILLAIPPERASGVYGVIEAIRTAAAHLGLGWLVPVGAACVVLDRVGSLCLWLGALARIPISAGIADYLPRSFARIDPRHRSPANAIWIQAVLVAGLVLLGQSGTSVRGAYNVLIEMMVVTSMLPFMLLFGAAIKLSSGPPVKGESRMWGGRPMLILVALTGLLATAGSIVVAFVPPPEEEHPAMAVLKVAGMTAILLLLGASLYGIGNRRARHRSRAEQPNAAW